MSAPPPPLAAVTTTVPVIVGWMAHAYANVPAVANVIVADCPGPSDSVSNPAPVAVCAALSSFVHVTESPAPIVIEPGTKAKPAMRTGASAARAVPPAAQTSDADAPSSPTTIRRTRIAPSLSHALIGRYVLDGGAVFRVYPHRPMTAVQRPGTAARERANELVRAWDGRAGHIGDPLGSLMGRVSTVDQVGVESRVDGLRKRSIKKASKLWALDLAIRMMDLTTLEGKDTPGKVRALCVKAMHPKPGDPTIPHVAAICVYPALVAEAKEALAGSGVKVASVATGFPSGQTFRDIKLAETRAAVDAGADEIDMVIDRGAFLSGDYQTVFEEIVEVKEACGDAHLKVILETGELGTYDNVRRASILAMAAGADFIKTSTGKVTPAATLPVTLVMLEAIRDFERATGRQVGMKPAGGIRTAKEAIQYLVVLYETLGPRWMTPDWFRFGASSLLNDVLMQIEFQRTGRYQDPDHFTLD